MVSKEKFEEKRWQYWVRIAVIPIAVIPLLTALIGAYISHKKIWPPDPPNSCTAAQDGSQAGWGPDRVTVGNGPYEFASQPSFNVDRENPVVGDERNFFGVKEGSYTDAGQWASHLQVRPGATYLFRTYMHNGANESPENIARNTRLTIDLPTCAGTSIAVRSEISASNTVPDRVWSTVVLHSPVRFALEFVPGSGRLYNNAAPKRDGILGIPVPDRVATSDGVLIGSGAVLDGNFGGNYQNVGYQTIEVRVVAAP
ncbi:hypothetical protein J2W56_004262 [Nocardia kruczakiae]|uniref:Uncharacterized protein n=1 Tax=Nocardia kruczakiae TaxID=261477 RepID=A0ABU1XIZ6_9NOCA|nr:hypothetical protein [Nocardia kruczakiae]MDR7170511.1 hypothetical protein [Nocardia kruczakiae]